MRTAAPADRADALCWVCHLVGDIHQPLHCVSLFNATFTSGDRGGNSIHLAEVSAIPDVAGIPAFPDRAHTPRPTAAPPVPDASLPGPATLPEPTSSAPPHNLHALWDDLLGGTRSPADIDKIAASLQTPANARATFPQLQTHTDVHAWVMESAALARQYVYLNGNLPQTPSVHGPATGPGAETDASLPVGYVSQAQTLALRQITLAGYRLADTLTSALAPQ